MTPETTSMYVNLPYMEHFWDARFWLGGVELFMTPIALY